MRLAPAAAPHLPLLARVRPRPAAPGSSTASASTGPSTRARAPLRCRQAASRPLRPGGGRAARPTTARRPVRAGDNAAYGDEERGGRPLRATTGRETHRCAARSRRRSSTSCMCAGFTRHPSSGVAPRPARHLRRADREDPLPAGARHDGGGAAAGLPVRRAGRARRARSTTGATRRCPSSPRTAAYSSRRRPARRARRVPRHGQGPAPRRHRGHPRRRLQPHRRGRRATGPTLCFRGLDNRAYYILDERPGPLRQLHRLRQHAQRATIPWCAGSSSTACATGWRRCTSTASASTWRRSWRATRRAIRCESARRSGTSRSDPVLAGTKLIAEAWDAAGLYQVGSFIGRPWAEWNGQFRDDVRALRARRPRHRRRASPTALLGSPDLYAPSGREPDRASTSSPATTASPLNDLVSYNAQAQRGQRRGQPRRRRRQPSAGTAASRARPTTRRSRRCATGR